MSASCCLASAIAQRGIECRRRHVTQGASLDGPILRLANRDLERHLAGALGRANKQQLLAPTVLELSVAEMRACQLIRRNARGPGHIVVPHDGRIKGFRQAGLEPIGRSVEALRSVQRHRGVDENVWAATSRDHRVEMRQHKQLAAMHAGGRDRVDRHHRVMSVETGCIQDAHSTPPVKNCREQEPAGMSAIGITSEFCARDRIPELNAPVRPG
jgi:hypothetical protein